LLFGGLFVILGQITIVFMNRNLLVAGTAVILAAVVGYAYVLPKFNESVVSGQVPEMALPADADLVMGLDYSNDKQVENLKELMAAFPDAGLKAKMIEAYDAEVEEGFKYETALAPIVAADWHLVLGMKVRDGVEGIEDLENFDSEDGDIYLAGYFEKADEVEVLIADQMAKDYGEALQVEEKDGRKFWTDPEDGVLMRDGNLFVFTDKEENMDAAVERLENGTGFVVEQKDYLAYMMMNGEILDEVTGIDGYMGHISYAVTAEKDGFRFAGDQEVTAVLKELYKMYEGDSLVLVDKVPAEGMMIYGEMPSVKTIVDGFLKSPALLMTGVEQPMTVIDDEGADVIDSMENVSAPVVNAKPTESEIKAAGEEMVASYNAGLELVATKVGVSKGDLEAVMDAPFAFAMSDAGTLYPTMAMYFQLDDAKAVTANKMMDALDSYMGEILVEFDKAVAAQNIPAGLLVKDAEKSASGLRRVYLDSSKLPAEILAQASMFVDLKTVPVEFYYGVTADNVLVMALYPKFADVYGKEVLADNADFKKAVAKLENDKAPVMSYMVPGNVMVLADRYVELVKKFGVMSAEDLETYGMVSKFVKTIKYMVAVNKVEGEVLKGEGFIGVEKVEE